MELAIVPAAAAQTIRRPEVPRLTHVDEHTWAAIAMIRIAYREAYGR